MLQYGVSGTVVRNYVNSNKFLQGSTIDKEKLLNEKYAAPKREEIQNLCSKYSLNEMVMKRLAKESIMNDDLECGTITKTTDYLANILKIIFDYSDEEFLMDIENMTTPINEVEEKNTMQNIKNKLSTGVDLAKKGTSQLASKLKGNKNSKVESDPYEEMKKAKELLDMGIITQEEFDKKKKDLLNL